jgi:hypothetical protein
VLEVLLASPDTLGEAAEEAERLGSEAREHAPLVALARAVIAAESGNAGAAARAYAEIAAAAEAAGEVDDAELARLAAAREWLRAGRPERARPLVEAVLAAHPHDAHASDLLGACNMDLAMAEAVTDGGRAPDPTGPDGPARAARCGARAGAGGGRPAPAETQPSLSRRSRSRSPRPSTPRRQSGTMPPWER